MEQSHIRVRKYVEIYMLSHDEEYFGVTNESRRKAKVEVYGCSDLIQERKYDSHDKCTENGVHHH